METILESNTSFSLGIQCYQTFMSMFGKHIAQYDLDGDGSNGMDNEDGSHKTEIRFAIQAGILWTPKP